MRILYVKITKKHAKTSVLHGKLNNKEKAFNHVNAFVLTIFYRNVSSLPASLL